MAVIYGLAALFFFRWDVPTARTAYIKKKKARPANCSDTESFAARAIFMHCETDLSGTGRHRYALPSFPSFTCPSSGYPVEILQILVYRLLENAVAVTGILVSFYPTVPPDGGELVLIGTDDSEGIVYASHWGGYLVRAVYVPVPSVMLR